MVSKGAIMLMQLFFLMLSDNAYTAPLYGFDGDFLNSGFNIDPSYIVTMIVPTVDETTTEIPTTTTTTTTTTRRTTTTTIDNSNLLKLIDFASQYGYMRLNYDKSRDVFYQTNEYYNFHSTTPSPSTVDTLLAALQTNN